MTLGRRPKDFTMRRAVLLALTTVAIAACQTGTTTGMPTASSQPPPEDLLPAFTNTIWPAIVDYNKHRSQGGPESERFHDIMDPDLKGDNAGIDGVRAYSALRDAAQNLGQTDYDNTAKVQHSSSDITAAHSEVSSFTSNTAAVNVCYTYTHSWYRDVKDKQQAPAASEATVELVNVDNTWYLRAITDDHVVPSCTSGRE